MYSTSRRYFRDNLKTIHEVGEASGGQFVDDTHFVADGNQVTSMWSWLVFMRHDVEKRRSFGVPLPKPNLKVGFEEQATTFINSVADKVLTSGSGRDLVPCQATFARLTSSRSAWSAALRFRQAM